MKRTARKLTLAKETIANLQAEHLSQVRGGGELFPTSVRSFISFCGTQCISICQEPDVE